MLMPKGNLKSYSLILHVARREINAQKDCYIPKVNAQAN